MQAENEETRGCAKHAIPTTATNIRTLVGYTYTPFPSHIYYACQEGVGIEMSLELGCWWCGMVKRL